MKRLLLLGALAFVAVLTMAARPPGEFPLILRLNGQPAWIATSVPGADGGALAVVDAGLGAVVKSQCHAVACICPGMSCVCPSATNLASFNNATVGEKLAVDAVHYMVLTDGQSKISTAAYSGSVTPDGGSGAWCDHWLMQ